MIDFLLEVTGIKWLHDRTFTPVRRCRCDEFVNRAYMKAEVITKSEKEHVVILDGHELGTSKLRSDADLHANVINNALASERQDGYDGGYSEGYDDGQ